MSSSTTTQGRSDAHTLSQLSDAHCARDRFQDQRSALVLSLRGGASRTANDGDAPEFAGVATLSMSGQKSGQRRTVVEFAGAAQREFVEISESIESLEKKIDTLRAALSPSGAMIYRKLSRSNRLPFMSHVANGVCGGCNMRVPSALTASVISRRKSEQCPSCARLLLAEGDAMNAAGARG